MGATFYFYNTDIRPDSDLQLDIGTDALRFNNLYVGGVTQFNDVNYTWPSADGSANDVLTTDGAGTMSWATPQSSFISVAKWGSVTL